MRDILSLFAALAIFLVSGLGMAHAAGQKPNPKIHYGLKGLPEPVRKMYREIYRAARSGDLSLMQEVLELNELLPAINETYHKDPVSVWKKESIDGQGLSVMAGMSRILEAGFVRRDTGAGSALYIWPYLAETNLKTLKQHQKVQLFRIAPAKKALGMLKAGRYKFYSLGIGEDGTWHFFRNNE